MKNLLKEAEKVTFKVDKTLSRAGFKEMTAKKVADANELMRGVELPETPRSKRS